jgi:hypothetical protein
VPILRTGGFFLLFATSNIKVLQMLQNQQVKRYSKGGKALDTTCCLSLIFLWQRQLYQAVLTGNRPSQYTRLPFPATHPEKKTLSVGITFDPNQFSLDLTFKEYTLLFRELYLHALLLEPHDIFFTVLLSTQKDSSNVVLPHELFS